MKVWTNLGKWRLHPWVARVDTPNVQHRSALDDDSFAAVLDGARKGEAWAIEQMFIDLQPRLLRFLRSLEPRVADDLAGEVWLALAQGVRNFEGDLGGFRAWVFTIARRRLADHRRTAMRRRTEPVGDLGFAESPGGADPEDHVLDRLSAQEAIDSITDALPPELAELLLLRVVAGLDVARVAEVLDRTPNWVRVMQHRALRRLAGQFPAPIDETADRWAPPVIPAPPRAIFTA